MIASLSYLMTIDGEFARRERTKELIYVAALGQFLLAVVALTRLVIAQVESIAARISVEVDHVVVNFLSRSLFSALLRGPLT
jgi:hypothetical protein